MLASTVQFSNNDQTPTLRTRRHLAWSRHPRGNNVPSGPNSVPGTPGGDRRSTLRRAVLAIPTVCAE
jgi:hypothetical protein